MFNAGSIAAPEDNWDGPAAAAVRTSVTDLAELISAAPLPDKSRSNARLWHICKHASGRASLLLAGAGRQRCGSIRTPTVAGRDDPHAACGVVRIFGCRGNDPDSVEGAKRKTSTQTSDEEASRRCSDSRYARLTSTNCSFKPKHEFGIKLSFFPASAFQEC